MRFNLLLADQSTDRLQELEDVLRPLLFGLRAAGHTVCPGAQECKPPPMVNLAIEGFCDLDADAIARARSKAGILFGVLCPTPPDAPPPARRDSLGTLPAVSDFAWTVEGIALPPDLVDPRQGASLGYGFDEPLVGPHLITHPALRDLDVVIYGPEGARTDALAARVVAMGLQPFSVRPGALPDYLSTHLLSRAKVVVVIDERLPPTGLTPRVLKAIYNGAAVVTEPGATTADRFGHAVAYAAYDDLPAPRPAVVVEGRYVGLGLTALDRLRTGVSMGDCAAAALRLPAFKHLLPEA